MWASCKALDFRLLEHFWGAMNYVERTFEILVGYPIDWDATGTWAGAVTTAVAVFIAAVLTEAIERRAERRRAADRLEVLGTVYSAIIDVMEMVAEYARDSRPLTNGFQASIDDLRAVLETVPILELPGKDVAVDLVAVRRISAHVSDEIRRCLEQGDRPPPPEVQIRWRRPMEAVREASERVLLVAKATRGRFSSRGAS